ncbi:MAG: recombinase family protein [Nanoarchaeota archaeon]|nr:recombinase family protein [Nanoarchaeota archaeon]
MKTQNHNPYGAYVRVSDDKLKTDGERRQDVNRQIEKIKKFHEAMEWPEPEFFIDDGKSAYKEDYNSRPDFCRMLREIRANRKKRITIEELERWSRRIEDGLKTMREVAEKNCTVTSIAQGEVDVTLPEGWFKTAVAFLLAEWSSISKSYKVKGGMMRRLDDPNAICKACGNVHLGRVPNKCKEILK